MGDPVTIAGATRQVVGVVPDPIDLSLQALVVALKDAPGRSALLVDLPSGTDLVSMTRGLEDGGWDVVTRDEVAGLSSEQLLLVVVLGGFGLLVTGLVTAATFAVSAQRRRHDLALLTATGAEPRHLRRSVSGPALVLACWARPLADSRAGDRRGAGATSAGLDWHRRRRGRRR